MKYKTLIHKVKNLYKNKILAYSQVETLNDRILKYIEDNKERKIPKRETVFNMEILIPCYNHGRFLLGLLNSLNTKNKKIPITIINDNSTDDTDRIVNMLLKKYDFKYIKNDRNLKQSGSLNKAINSSANNLFIVLNADDYLICNWVQYVEKSFSDTNISMLGGEHPFYYS